MSGAVTERSPRVLVVDDEAHVRTMLCDLLAVWGYKAESAPSATQGLALLEREAYDLVLTDFRMPGMSGMELAECIRARDARVRVIMLTASAVTLESACRRLDVTLLRKPLEIERLKAVLDQVLDRGSEVAPLAVAPAAATRDT